MFSHPRWRCPPTVVNRVIIPSKRSRKEKIKKNIEQKVSTRSLISRTPRLQKTARTPHRRVRYIKRYRYFRYMLLLLWWETVRYKIRTRRSVIIRADIYTLLDIFIGQTIKLLAYAKICFTTWCFINAYFGVFKYLGHILGFFTFFRAYLGILWHFNFDIMIHNIIDNILH